MKQQNKRNIALNFTFIRILLFITIKYLAESVGNKKLLFITYIHERALCLWHFTINKKRFNNLLLLLIIYAK